MPNTLFQKIDFFIRTLPKATLNDENLFVATLKKKNFELPITERYTLYSVIRNLVLTQSTCHPQKSLFNSQTLSLLLTQTSHTTLSCVGNLLQLLNERQIDLIDVTFLKGIEYTEENVEQIKGSLGRITDEALLSPANLSIIFRHSTPKKFITAYQSLKIASKLSPNLFIALIDWHTSSYDQTTVLEEFFNQGLPLLLEHELATDENIKIAIQHNDPMSITRALIFIKQRPNAQKYRAALPYCVAPEQFIENCMFLAESGIENHAITRMMSLSRQPEDIAQACHFLAQSDLLNNETIAFLLSIKLHDYLIQNKRYRNAATAFQQLTEKAILPSRKILALIQQHPEPHLLANALIMLDEQNNEHEGVWNEVLIDFLGNSFRSSSFYAHLNEILEQIIILHDAPSNFNLERILSVISQHKNPLSAAKAYAQLGSSELANSVKAIIARNISTHPMPHVLFQALERASQAGLDEEQLKRIAQSHHKAIEQGTTTLAALTEGYIACAHASIDVSLPIVQHLFDNTPNPEALVNVIAILLRSPDIMRRYNDKYDGLSTKMITFWRQHLGIKLYNIFQLVDGPLRLSTTPDSEQVIKILTCSNLNGFYHLCTLLQEKGMLSKTTLHHILSNDKISDLTEISEFLYHNKLLRKENLSGLINKSKPDIQILNFLLKHLGALGIAADQAFYEHVIKIKPVELKKIKHLMQHLVELEQKDFARELFMWGIAHQDALDKAIEFAESIHLIDLAELQRLNIPFDTIFSHPDPISFCRTRCLLVNQEEIDAWDMQVDQEPQQIVRALETIGPRKITSIHWNIIRKSADPYEVAKAYILIDDNQLLTKNNLEQIAAHTNPMSVAFALVYLETYPQEHEVVNRTSILRHADPYSFCKLLDKLAAHFLLSTDIYSFVYQYQAIPDLDYLFDFIWKLSQLSFIDSACYQALTNAALSNENIECLNQILDVFSETFNKEKLDILLRPRCRWLLSEEGYANLWTRLPISLTDEQLNRLLTFVRPNGNNPDHIFNYVMQNNQGQTTHTASIHKSSSESASRLQQRYQLTSAQVNDLTEKLWELLNQDDYYAEEPDQAVFKAKKRAALDGLVRLRGVGHHFKDPASDIRLDVLIALATSAILDDEIRSSSLQVALCRMVHAFYDIQRGYNYEDTHDKDVTLVVRGTKDQPICLSGSFNKIIEKLVSIHVDCELIYLTKDSANEALPRIIQHEANNYLTIEKAKAMRPEEQSAFDAQLKSIKKSGYLTIMHHIQDAIKESFLSRFGDLYQRETPDEIMQIIAEGIEYSNVDEHSLNNFLFNINPSQGLASSLGMFAAAANIDLPPVAHEKRKGGDMDEQDIPAAKRPGGAPH